MNVVVTPSPEIPYRAYRWIFGEIPTWIIKNRYGGSDADAEARRLHPTAGSSGLVHNRLKAALRQI